MVYAIFNRCASNHKLDTLLLQLASGTEDIAHNLHTHRHPRHAAIITRNTPTTPTLAIRLCRWRLSPRGPRRHARPASSYGECGVGCTGSTTLPVARAHCALDLALGW